MQKLRKIYTKTKKINTNTEKINKRVRKSIEKLKKSIHPWLGMRLLLGRDRVYTYRWVYTRGWVCASY